MRGRSEIALGPLVALVGAVLLAISLFLDWYDGFTAFTIFEVVDLLLLSAAVVAGAAALERLGAGPWPGLPRTAAALLPAGLLALVLTAGAALNHPPAAIDRDAQTGQWLALAAAVVIVAGAVLSSVRIRLAVAPRDAAPASRPRRPAAGDPSEAPTQSNPPAEREG